jgi:hypothetical protein
MVGTVAVTYFVAEIIKLFVKPIFSSHKRLRGPPSPSVIFGHMLVEADIEVGEEKVHPQEQWRREYGHIFKTVSFLGVSVERTLFGTITLILGTGNQMHAL